MARISLDGHTVIPVALLPEPVVAVIASWIVIGGDAPMVDRCILDSLDADGAFDPEAFAALYAAEHERYWGSPWVLPMGACAIDGATGRATILVPREIVQLDDNAPPGDCACPECSAIRAEEAADAAAEASMRGQWRAPAWGQA